MYENDARLDFDCDGQKEYWIGEKSTTSLKVILWDEDNEDERFLVDYLITADKLRENTQFLVACLENEDVNHSLYPDNFNNASLDKECAQDLFDWYLGKKIEMPITPCGMENYCMDYIG